MKGLPKRRMEAMHENKQPQFLIHHANDPRFLHLRSLQLPPRPLSHRPLPDRRHSTRRPGRRRARPDSVVVPLSGSSIKPIRKEAGTKAPPVWHSQRAARSAALSRSYARGGAAGAGRRCPAAMVSISDVQPAKGCVWLAVESIDSPGNLGTIIRTAEATGVTGIVVIGATPIRTSPRLSGRAWDRCFYRG